MTEEFRYEWIVRFDMAGGVLDAEDAAFKAKHEAGMRPEERERWELMREYGG